MTGQMFGGPDTHPGHQSKSEDRVTQDAFGGAHLCRIEPQPGLDVGKQLFDGPAPGESLNQKSGFESEVGRRQVRGFAFALRVPDDDDLKLKAGLRPPSDEGFVIETDEPAINFDPDPFPAATGLSNRRKTRKPASVFGSSSPLFGFPFGQRGSQDGIETQTAGQRNTHLEQGFEDGLVVVSPVGNERNLEGNPGFDLLKRLDRNLEPRTKLRFGTVLLGSVKRDPKGQSHRNAKQLDDHGQDHPIVSPDVAGPGPAGVIPEGTGAINMFAPFALKDCSAGTERIVDSNQKLLQLKGLDDQLQKSFEENLVAKPEMGEEALKARFVAFEARSVTEPADMPLAGLNQPRDCGGTKIRPASFGKGQTKVEDYFRKFRCSSVVDHGPFSWGCEFVS